MNIEAPKPFSFSLNPIPPGEQGGILFPGLTPEQSENTMALLELVADTYGSPYACLIMETHLLRRDVYDRYWDPVSRKWINRMENGKRIAQKRAGIDRSAPNLYDIGIGNSLYCDHQYFYGSKSGKDDQERVHPPRASLLETVLSSSGEQSYLFYPVLVSPHPMMQTLQTEEGEIRHVRWNYTTLDVAAARCAWVDVDGHDLSTDEIKRINPIAIQRFMAMLPEYCVQTNLPVPAVVNSGRGIHLYWWLDRAVPLQTDEEMTCFKDALRALNRWAGCLIDQDPICRSVWKADSSCSTIFHQLNLPGCIHPKLGVPRYVINKLGRDYSRCCYADLYSTMLAYTDPTEESEPENTVCTDQEAVPEQVQTETAIPRCNTDILGKDADKHTDRPSTCDTKTEKTYQSPAQAGAANRQPYEGRVNRLLRWAEGRNWDLYPGRETFLFICAVLMQHSRQYTNMDDIDRELVRLNQKLAEPLPDSEVSKIVPGLERKMDQGNEGYRDVYIFTNDWVADTLKMTLEERKLFCISAGEGAYSRSGLTFTTKFNQILAAMPWDPECESAKEHRQRCYRETQEWFAEKYRGQSHNGARQRRRAARPEYTGKPGRYKKDVTEEQTLCVELKEKGLSERQIASELGFSKSKVHRLLGSYVVQKMEE